MTVLETLLFASVLASIPIMLAAAGEAVGQRGGLLNLGVEGVMLSGALAAFVATEVTSSFTAGLVAGAATGAMIGLLFGIVATRLAASQIVLGLGIALAGQGATGYLFRERYGLSQPLLDASMTRPFAEWSDIAVVGPMVFGQKWFVYAGLALTITLGVVLRWTRGGLVLRASGDSPFATEAAGIDVGVVRIWAATLGQALVGLGGAALAVVEVGFFTPGMTVGIGFIAIALAMVGRQDPWRIMALALSFGVLKGLGGAIQLTDWHIRTDVLDMIPYIGVILLVVLLGRRVRLPAALGVAYHRGARE